MGFDAVEILHRQMESETNQTLQQIKRRAFLLGLDVKIRVLGGHLVPGKIQAHVLAHQALPGFLVLVERQGLLDGLQISFREIFIN